MTDPACKYFVAVESGLLVAVCAIKDGKHIYHLFVAPEAQGRGVARALWEYARADAELDGATGRFTVNSSLHAVPVYERLGFHAIDSVQERNGVRFVPMASVR
ncbi:GNAT family N-acetyltransferase [Cupriavidus necator]